MSSAPEPGWPHSPAGHPSAGHPSAGHPPAGHPSAGQTPPPAASFSWRLKHSWWLLLPVLGLSCLGGVGFLYVGLRARRPAWWIAGIGYLLIGWTAFILTGEAQRGSGLADWMAGLVLVVWITSIVHAFMINSAWLRWRAGYRPWYTEQRPGGPSGAYPPGTLAPPPGLSPATPPAQPTSPGFAPVGSAQQAAAYYGPGPAAATGPAQGAGPVGPLDVNAARLDDLAALPGFDPQRARQVLTERDRRGGFGSLTEFTAAAGLAPHEYARLRDLLVCPPPGRPAAGQPPQGRVLDV
ncbi:hypothetical protein E0H26_26205 [Micromonospora zingiberis]|uniref:Helix-hairpin-helix domain-containing protein n=1 Tax=Micromonospora zingiberis TaxID=2053011 RepID=A0A4R0G2Z8_9ACTN|nr:helix-hairpin-helix domain-containing protein [Micromonospora zingiberis]TCB90984.1 hypothetical protein E0H26_26205 [Micromonospora zingiberis]